MSPLLLAAILSGAVALGIAFIALLQRFLNPDGKQAMEYQAKFDALQALGKNRNDTRML